MKPIMEPEDEIRALKSDLAAEEARFLECKRQRDELARALEIALGQLEGVKSMSGCHSGSLRADIAIARTALARCDRGGK